ncbi:hypothetical protein SAMN05444358_1011698 [Ruegeria halocynthiae]|uniref:Uncharacterized protein n=1 Tax=Ruegeria halocynthiae TaxID=985054 RepID=A0A1H2W731_9RHOB|nr:hypothetical protein [Ruegeria halocynthiae]SDW76483.1 hypothetical protein SAMN05444358_1011698 [Ruegeria halocynthiae]
MDDGENFRSIVANDDKLKARWEAVSSKIMADSSRLLGVELSREDVVAMPSARIATLTDAALSESYLDEIKQLEAAQEQVRKNEVREALEAGEEQAHAELARLSPTERMSKARELGLTGGTPMAEPSSIADEATLLRRLLTLSPSERIAKGRAWGLIK